jgi:hypothetical protein
MIINESEKNRIKSLYGLLTEDAPPPDESVLVANKNPFSDSSKDLTKGIPISNGYKSNLSEGALFFTFDSDSIKKWILDTVNKSPINGKSVRAFDKNKTEDVLINIPDFLDANLSFTRLEGSPSDKERLSFTVLFDKGPYSEQHIKLNSDGSIIKVSRRKDEWPYDYRYREYGEFITNSETNTKILNIIKPLVNLGSIPDEYFEIRKIEKQKTDF